MALTKVSGPLLHGSDDNLGNYVINNITGAAATFTGNVSVGGTLTYDDVTNVESVGIVTAKGGLHVGAAGTIIHALSEDNGKVGIGSAVPTAKLEVRGSGSNTTLNFLTKDVNRNNVSQISILRVKDLAIKPHTCDRIESLHRPCFRPART